MNRKYLAFLTFFASSFSAYGQAGSADFPVLAPAEIYILNSSPGNTLSFLLWANACRRPIDETLKPGYASSYVCERATSFHMKIVTDTGKGPVPITATLSPRKRYEIYWANNEIWNVRELQ